MDARKRELKNGLIVATEVMPHLRSASIGVWVRGGSRCEPQEKTGISHFIEHLLFKGTTTRTASDIAKEIDSVGGQLDAFTDKEYVGYYAKVQDRHLDLAFSLLSDIILNPTFPPEEIRRERNVIFEEINMVEDTPLELIQDLFMENFWKGHPLGNPISGTKKSVASITRRDALKHFRKHYTARNTLISVAGNITHGGVHERVKRYFSEMEPGTASNPGATPLSFPARVVRRKRNLEQAHLCFGTPCPPMNSRDRYCTHVLNGVLGGGMSSRLFQNIREKRGLVYNIYSIPNLYLDAGNILIYAAAAPEAAPEVVELTLRELRRVRDRLVAAEELHRAKENLKGSVLLSLESSSSRMTNLAQQLIYFDRFYSPEEIVDGFEGVRAADVRRLANEIFDPKALSMTALTSGNGRDLQSIEFRV